MLHKALQIGRQKSVLKNGVQYNCAKFFLDERYIRINGKPLLIVYRPELFPNIRETVKRWREWCIENGIGDLYLACTHSFVHNDPRDIGFDAAIDYPPNTYPLKPYNHKFKIINPNYSGNIILYDELIKISQKMLPPPYKKFRGICPSWDNEPRRPGRGTVIHGSTPEKYKKWLEYLIDYTRQHFPPEERFIFINAWNEWAESAYLEPDRKFGYAYLEATYEALKKKSSKRKPFKILFISHDASFGGAQKVLVNLMEWIKSHTFTEIYTICLAGGNYLDAFKKVSNVKVAEISKLTIEDIIDFCDGVPDIIYVNTVSCIGIYDILKQLKKPIVTHIHELYTSIKKYSNEKHVREIIENSCLLIAVSNAVKNMLVEKFNADTNKIAVINPFIKIHTNDNKNLNLIKEQLRLKYGIPTNATVIVGCGIGMPFRKGADLFLEIARLVRNNNLIKEKNIVFYWIGDFAPEEYDELYGRWDDYKKTIEKENLNVVFTGFVENPQDFYVMADIFLMTSREDPYPLVMLEAAFYELPILCFEFSGGPPEFIEDKNLICKDVQDMYEKLLYLINNEKLRKQYGEFLRKKLLNNNLIDISAWNIYTLIRNLAGVKPLVSVIVPNYNYGKYLRKRLDSILNQTFKDFELILLDDASNDDSVNIMKEYSEKFKFIKMYINEKNTGSPFRQWVKGLKLARGDYVWIAEADDLSEPNFLRSLIEKMIIDDSVKLSFARSYIIDETDRVVGDYALSEYIQSLLPHNKKDKFLTSYINSSTEEINDGLGINNYIPNISSVVFKNDISESVLNQIENFKMCGDWFFIVNHIKDGKVYYNAEIKNYHRRHSESVFGKLFQGKTDFMEIFFNEYFRVLNFIFENYRVEDETKKRLQIYIKHLWEQQAEHKTNWKDFIERYIADRIRSHIYEAYKGVSSTELILKNKAEIIYEHKFAIPDKKT